jgi:hypothetical protein
MKRLILLFATALLMTPFILNAQSPIDKVFEKYAGQERFTSVNITKDMFQMFQNMVNSTDTSAMEMKKMMEQLNGLKVLTYDVDTTEWSKAVGYYNEFAGLFPLSSYKELMTVNEGRESFRFLTKQDAAGKVTELVLLMKGRHDVGVLSLTGSINLSDISKISKGMNIKGMENLQKLKEHQKH